MIGSKHAHRVSATVDQHGHVVAYVRKSVDFRLIFSCKLTRIEFDHYRIIKYIMLEK